MVHIDFIAIFKCLKDPFIKFVKDPLIEAFGHVSSCEDNMESLAGEIAKLQWNRTEMQRMLDEGEIPRTAAVELWILRASKLTDSAEGLKDGYNKMLKIKCMVDISPNVWASYKNSTDAITIFESAQTLVGWYSGAIDAARWSGQPMPMGSVVGHDSEYEKLEEHDRDDSVSIIGIHGTGAVGETV